MSSNSKEFVMCIKMSREHADITARINEISADDDVKFVVIFRKAGGDLDYVPVGSMGRPEMVINTKVNEHCSHLATINFFGPVDEQIRFIPPYWGDAATVDIDRHLVAV